MTETQIIILVISMILLISVIIVLLSGLFIVKKDDVCIFEKFYKFYKVKTKGIYFFPPFLTKRVGKYSLKNQYLKINLNNNKIYLIYKINDAKKYHYSPLFKDEIYKSLIIAEENNNNFLETIKNTCVNHGISIISLKINEELID